MASLGAEEFYLIDMWPGTPNANLSEPTTSLDSTVYNTVTTPYYLPGTKLQICQDVTVTTTNARSCNQGYSTLIYAKFVEATNSGDCTACDIVTLFCISTNALGPLAVTKDVSAGMDGFGGPVAIAVADITPDAYGWFWCGGVCPQEAITAMDVCIYVTDGSVVGGIPLALSWDSSECQLAQYEITVAGHFSVLPIGFAYVNDA